MAASVGANGSGETRRSPQDAGGGWRRGWSRATTRDLILPRLVKENGKSGQPMSRSAFSRLGSRIGLRAIVFLLPLLTIACRAARDSKTSPPLTELIQTFSEPGGYFDTDNLVSNETSYVQVVDRLEPIGGAYIGVGPEQNFTYIARIRPRWAFIVDIRRENMLQHLLFNAVLSQAKTPYQYLCWMFSRPVREAAEPQAAVGIRALVSAFEREAPSRELFRRNQETLLRHVEEDLAIELRPGDRQTLRSIYAAFFREQLEIRFHSHGRPPLPHHPTYRKLLMARSPGGRDGHFLASLDDYSYVRELAMRGRIVPVVGDFAGPHALRAIGRFLEEQGEDVSAFYVSNVEFYLMRSGRFRAYVDNLRSLPAGEDSLLVRAYFDYGLSHPERLPGHRSTILLQRISRFLTLYDSDAYHSYWDVCTMDYMR